MLRLSKKADYALMAMKHLALRGDGSSSAREIAGLYDIPIELLAKILQRLVRGGLLDGRGSQLRTVRQMQRARSLVARTRTDSFGAGRMHDCRARGRYAGICAG